MSRELAQSYRGIRSARGRISSRLLLNALADPTEVASRLPEGVRPHVSEDDATVVGACLLEIHDLRPRGLPAIAGVGIRAVAHRISVEWTTPSGGTDIGVYVPMRHTDSRLASMLGGRWFPGVHRHAPVDVVRTPTHLDWRVGRPESDPGFALEVRVDISTPVIDQTPKVCAACVDATVGLSPDHQGQLEVAHMVPERRDVRAVHVEELRSTFFEGFASATPAMAYLMEDLGVRWSADPAAIEVGATV